jgi:parvulin-like peptidyl-prolyl isomerase
MKPFTRQFFSVALASLMLGTMAGHATSATPNGTTNATPADAMTALFGDPVIAKGKGFEIKRSALDQIMVGAKGQAAAANQQLPADFEARALNQLITIQLLLQVANDADRAAGQKDADLQYTNILKHFGSEEAFARQLKAVGMTMDELRAKALQEATAKAALKRELNVTVTDDEVLKLYTDRPADFEEPEKAHVQHLLLMTIDPTTQAPLSADQVAEKRKQIDALLVRARAGENFTNLVKEYSEDPGSKATGGEYNFSRGQMVPEFEAAAFSMTNGQISDVVITKYGFHIIKLLGKSPAKKVELATVSDDIRNYLIQQKISKLAPAYITKLKAEDDVMIMDADLKAKLEAAEAAAAAAAAADNAAPGTSPAGGSNP